MPVDCYLRACWRRARPGMLGAALVAWPLALLAAPDTAERLSRLKLTPAAEIQRRVDAARPLKNPTADLKHRLGATHYAGTYSLSQEPYLIEGAKALEHLGFGVAKFWFNPRGLSGYGFNSQWNLSPSATLVDLARHPYFEAAFRRPFSTFALEVTSAGRHGNRLWLEDEAFFADTEQQAHDLARYLLETYRQRKVTFIIQNWEGDWMMRDSTTNGYAATPGPDAERRFAGMRRWLEARQRGVNRARQEVRATQARVLHALEVNKVLDSLAGIPTLTTDVLPQVELDLISWSSYDGMKDTATAWHGIEIIRHFSRARTDGTKPPVFIGEIGNPENEGRKTEAQIREWWDERLGVFLALEIPWIIHWELYCNEPKDKNKRKPGPRRAEELRGFWLLRPDGTLSWSGKYFQEILEKAAKQ